MIILTGTASWTDPSLVQSHRFYPRGVNAPAAMLAFYASRFPVVEVNSSWYAIPKPETAQRWAAGTPEGFLFHAKLFRLFTWHQTEPRTLPPEVRADLADAGHRFTYYKRVPPSVRDRLWTAFRQAVEPLRAANKLGCLHLQMAPWFEFKEESIEHLRECRRQLDGYLVSVEFRNPTWFGQHQDEALDLLRELRFVNTVVDAPAAGDDSIPGVWVATSNECALVRLHGRNAETWAKPGLKASSERFDYDYSDEELRGLAERVRVLSREVRRTVVIFNNNRDDQSVRNAATMTDILRG